MTNNQENIETNADLPMLVARLRIENQRLRQENRDLKDSLANITEHGDAIEAELHDANLKLRAEARERERAERALRNLIGTIVVQNTDLEIIIQMLTDHGDALDRQWFGKFSEATELAGIDGLTQIPNRRRFDRYFDQQWQQMARESTPLSLIMCDVDAFKAYNDTYGHPVGDACLKQIAAMLAGCLQHPTDLAARYGGEEFAVLLPHTDLEGAMRVALRIQAAIRSLNILHESSPVGRTVTVSMGVASLVPGADDAIDRLARMADERLYSAKREGRDRIIGG